MTDCTKRDEIKNDIKKSGLKVSKIAEEMGISYQALYNKLNGISKFEVSEVVVLQQMLHWSNSRRDFIFFTPEVE